MTPMTPWSLAALSACMLMTAGCASYRPASAPISPPQATLPPEATAPCRLPRLGEAPTQADLETVYIQRGAAIVECDMARRAAVETLEAERRLLRRWLAGDGRS